MELKSQAVPEKDEIYGLDVLRFFSALLVMMFHLAKWCWVYPLYPYQENMYLIKSYAPISFLVSGGWVGVQIFFVISGFVIAYSASGVCAFDFGMKRVLRLFPGVFICATLSIFLLYAGGDEFHSIFIKYVNSLLFAPLGPWVANSYWTLTVEIVFYACIFFLIFFNRIRSVETFSELLLIWSLIFWICEFILPLFMEKPPFLFVMNKITQRVLLQYGCFFSLGITIWLGSQFGWSARRITSALLAVVVGVAAIFGEVDHSNAWFKTHDTAWMPVAFWCFGMAVIFASVKFNQILKVRAGKWTEFIKMMGKTTFPLYLIHQPLGKLIIRYLVRFGLDPFVALAIAVVINLGFSYYIASDLEPKLRKVMRRMILEYRPKRPIARLDDIRLPISG